MLLLANVPLFGPPSGPAKPAVHLARRPPPPGLTDDSAAQSEALVYSVFFGEHMYACSGRALFRIAYLDPAAEWETLIPPRDPPVSKSWRYPSRSRDRLEWLWATAHGVVVLADWNDPSGRRGFATLHETRDGWTLTSRPTPIPERLHVHRTHFGAEKVWATGLRTEGGSVLSVLCGRTLEPLETHTFTEDGRVRVEVRGEGVTHVQTGVARLDAYDVLCVAEDVITLVGGHDGYLIYVPSRRRVRHIQSARHVFSFLRPRELVVRGRCWALLNDDDWSVLHIDTGVEGRQLPKDVQARVISSRGNVLTSEWWDGDSFAVVARNAHASVYQTGHGGAVSPCGRFVTRRVGRYGSAILRFQRVLTFEELLEGILRESRCAEAAVLREGPVRRRLAEMLGVLE